jgi:cobalamin biosynthesis Mg chelatase CobN
LDSRITDNAETLSILTGSSNGSIEKQINDAVSAEAEIARAAELANQEAIAQIDNRTNIIETDYLKTSDKQELNNALESLDERVTNNVNSLLSFLNDKQDKINDIDAIRNNAEQALKQVPDEYITENELTQKQYVTESSLFDALSDKQDTISDLKSIREGAALGATSAQQ